MNKLLTLVSILLLSVNAFGDELSVKKLKLDQGNVSLPCGSGLAFKNKAQDGSLYFYILASGSFSIQAQDQGRPVEEVPHIILAKAFQEKLALESRLPVAMIGEQLSIDPEGIAINSAGDLWVADEEGGRLLKISGKTGTVMEVLVAGKDLPSIIKEVRSNRGIEGVTVAPDGKIYAIVQSPLDFKNKISQKARFVRLVEYNPLDRKTKMFAVPFDRTYYDKAEGVKFGDIQALGNGRFIVIEQGDRPDGAESNKIIEIDISAATDISKVEYSKKALEYNFKIDNDFEAGNIKPVKRKELVDLRTLGWKYKKAEGVTVIDSTTIAVINDWGDGVTENELWIIKLSAGIL